MKLALQRKASKRLVDRKDEVLALVRQASSLQPGSVADAVKGLRELESAADDLGLPLTGDEWGERLAIKKKGGGMHFEETDRGEAARAFSRANVLHSAVTWHEQLVQRGTQITSAVGAFRTKGGSGASMSKAKMLEKCTELLTNVGKTIHDIFADGAFKAALAEMAALNVPQNLQLDADELRERSLLLAEFAHELAHAELTGLRAEKKMKKFRAPQTLAVLVSAEQLVRSVDTAARPTTHVPHDTLQSLVDAIAEVRPMVGSGQGEGAADDELDDEI